MAGTVQLQSDVSALSIRGLGAFTSVLSILSADNVAPMAMIQVEKFGSLFNVSGKYAAQTPDLLRRFSEKPLGRLAIAIGWRKGDSASLLAETAGGQAAALISVALRNLFSEDRCGEIISQSCANLLPVEVSVASVLQLADVSNLLAQKMFAVGFGNFLAKQVNRVCTAYANQGLRQPPDLLDIFTVESATDLLCSSSRALREEATILRISGSTGMGYVLGLILFLFPHDSTLTVNGAVMHEGPTPKIYVEICGGRSGPVAVTLEQQIFPGNSSSFSLFSAKRPQNTVLNNITRYNWRGWLADHLQLTFARSGMLCTEEDRVAFANMLVSVANHQFRNHVSSAYGSIPYSSQFSDLLGSNSWHRMASICREVLHNVPVEQMALGEAFKHFTFSLQERIDRYKVCSCLLYKCNFASGWLTPRDRTDVVTCRANLLWIELGGLLEIGLYCFLIDADPNVAFPSLPETIVKQLPETINLELSLSQISDQYWPTPFGYGMDIFRKVVGLGDPGSFGGSSGQLARSSGSTIYPHVLETLHIPNGRLASFRLADGAILYQNRSFSQIFSASANPRPCAVRSLLSSGDQVIPSSLGEHSTLLMTVRETAKGLELRTSVRYDGVNIMLQLDKILMGYIMMRRTTTCPHPSDKPFSLPMPSVIATSIASPRPGNREISIAMTKGNSAAQILCCEASARALLLDGCCLDCAVQEAVKGKFGIIIVK